MRPEEKPIRGDPRTLSKRRLLGCPRIDLAVESPLSLNAMLSFVAQEATCSVREVAESCMKLHKLGFSVGESDRSKSRGLQMAASEDRFPSSPVHQVKPAEQGSSWIVADGYRSASHHLGMYHARCSKTQ